MNVCFFVLSRVLKYGAVQKSQTLFPGQENVYTCTEAMCTGFDDTKH